MYEHLYNFIKKEFSDLDRKAGTNGELNMQEVQYADLLAHFYKSLLTAEAMEKTGGSYNKSYNDGYSAGYSDGYSRSEGGYRDDSGYGARGRGSGAKRDSMGRYADESGSGYSEGSYQHDKSIISELHELMEKAPNERTRRRFEEFISEMSK